MIRSTRAREAAAYIVAGGLTAAVAFVASIPFTGLAATAVTADVAMLVGYPTLLVADAITARTKGGHQ